MTEKRYRRYLKNCIDCGVEIMPKATRCKPCAGRNRTAQHELKTIAELKEQHGHRWRDIIRLHAANVLPTEGEECRSCGYDKHVERAHVKDIASFDDDTLLKEINRRENLILLCPNCHWEFDNGLLILDTSIAA